MNLLNKSALVGFVGIYSFATASAASLSISGTNFNSLMNASGITLPAGSIIQVGYFLGINPSTTDPSAFGASEWDTFTALTGPLSLNSSLLASTENINATFQGVYRLNMTIDTESADANARTFPAFPSKIGVKIFDTTDPSGIASANFNTASSSLASWTATGADGTGGTGLVLGMTAGGSAANPELFWQSGPGGAFMTAVPEPSTSLSALLGLGLLVGARRRK
jgi:hypothetical protein